ncbi:helix-turn-helix transcriptional regulator [Tatumella terrea]|uniref:LuxR C-terminal-related transcriptional regulator n=1 Tax=Tatumella terrea TaxID=419007 RepID=A0ABW1VX67_9GAMM
MTLEIFFLDPNIYEVIGIKAIVCQQYPGDPADIRFPSQEEFSLRSDARIIFRHEAITMKLPVLPSCRQQAVAGCPVMTLHVPFLSRKCPVDDFALKIKKILSIATSARRFPLADSLSKLTGYRQLSDTEYQVMILIGRGMTCQDISRALNRSEKTISAHYRNVSRKMGAANRAEFYRYAFFISRSGGDRRNTLFL